jgi:CheY-like chemotaxis protein
MLKKLIPEETIGNRIEDFQKLMRFKIRDVLLISSMYDYYLFEEDGRLYEQLREEYQALSLSQAPEITHVTTAAEALEQVLPENHFDLIIATLHIEDMHIIKLAKKIREIGIKAPIVVLAYDNKERKELTANYDTSILEKIFIWQGDYRLIMGIIKYVEDKLNVESDMEAVGVQSIIIVEDNVKFYSSYLPLVYNEIFKQSRRLISEGVNLSHRYLRMRARPKILLCTNYEEGWEYFDKYESNVLGLILDINFKKNNIKDPEAGIKFARAVKKRQKDIPILLQSSNFEMADEARATGATFCHKGSPKLLHELHDFIMNEFGFGDFVFYTPDRKEVGRASNLVMLVEELKRVPAESILYHSERNHFSNWLKARTEFWLAHILRPRSIAEFNSVEDLRNELVNAIIKYQELRQRGLISDFNHETFDPKSSFARIGGGSLGGKARGLGFVNKLINNYDIRNRFEGIEITVPACVVLATDVFDQFLEDNQLFSFALNETDDDKINRKFIEADKFSLEALYKLKEFLRLTTVPLAVRSSSLLEDSQFQPFAGVYTTYMIPNNDDDLDTRLEKLIQCIKCVYASTFSTKAKDYIKATTYRLEEEKMAVIIQRLVGTTRNARFYPDFAGVAKSYNFYPVAPQKASDGIALTALGLGKMVVEGENSVRFCPKYPRHLLQFYSTKETVRNAQQKFYALDLAGSTEASASEKDFESMVQSYDLSYSEADNTLHYVGSTYSSENDAVYDGIARPGKRVVTFAPILKHKLFPLAEILDLLLETGTWGLGTNVEIEFAVNMSVPKWQPKEFAFLQMRPLVISQEMEETKIDAKDASELICSSNMVLGNGIIRGIRDVIFVDKEKFERGKSHDVAEEVAKFNAKLVKEKKPYILIGVGRWGSLDKWLGIPVTWDQIAGASVIVESGFKDFEVMPSQGSHFFQNITSFRVGYFTINSNDQNGFINWDWLNSREPVEEMIYTRHLCFDDPITVKINAHQNKGIIIKPGE